MGFLFKSRVSEIHVKRIHVNQGVWCIVYGQTMAKNGCKTAICQSTLLRDTLYLLHQLNNALSFYVTKKVMVGPNQLGQTKTILDRPKLFWSHRRTRHK
jgi:hypothetical protein